MTLFQVEELTSYWAQHPPLHVLVAAYLGVGRDKRPLMPPVPTREGQRLGPDAGSMLAQLGPGFGSGNVDAGLSPVVLDFAELRRQSAFNDSYCRRDGD